MSADNWTTCPRCSDEFEKGINRLKFEAGESYGKVSSEEYLDLLAIAEDAAKKEQEQTFREDYDIGVNSEGLFDVNYRGGCTKCGLSFGYEHTEQIPMDKPEDATPELKADEPSGKRRRRVTK